MVGRPRWNLIETVSTSLWTVSLETGSSQVEVWLIAWPSQHGQYWAADRCEHASAALITNAHVPGTWHR